MKNQHKIIQYTALLLSFSCLFAFAGCQKQRTAAVTGEPSEFTEISDTVLSQDTLPESEIPVISSEGLSSEEAPVSSKEEPVSSQQVSEQPASQAVPSSADEASSQVSLPAIPFTVGVVAEQMGYPMTLWGENIHDTFGATVIRSAAEYRERFAPDNSLIPSDADTVSVYRSKFSDYLSKYNETFFEENALIYMVTYHVRSCSLNDYIHSLVRSGSQLTIEYTVAVTDTPLSGPYAAYVMEDASGGRQTLLEVKKSDVEGVTEIVPQQIGEDTPPTWWF